MAVVFSPITSVFLELLYLSWRRIMAASHGHQQGSFSFLWWLFRGSLSLFLPPALTEHMSHLSPRGTSASA